MLARRDIPGKQGKLAVPFAGLASGIQGLLDEIHASLLRRATEFRQAHTHTPKDYAEFRQVVEAGWADAWWCGRSACEAAIKEETKATTRCLPIDQPGGTGRCIHCGEPAEKRALFARAY